MSSEQVLIPDKILTAEEYEKEKVKKRSNLSYHKMEHFFDDNFFNEWKKVLMRVRFTPPDFF